MKNPFPDTIAFRATTLLVVGLAVTHLLSNLFYTTDRETALLAAGGDHAIQWVATIGSLAGVLEESEWDEIIGVAASEQRFMRVTDAPLVPAATGSGWREAALLQELARHVPEAQIVDYRISYMSADAAEAMAAPLQSFFTGLGQPAAQNLIMVSLNLGGGKWLNIASPVSPSPAFFSARLGLSMLVMLAAVVLFSALLVRRMTAPLKQLSKAAEMLGTDVQAPAIPETGPEEVRRTAHAFNNMQKRIQRFVTDRTQMLGAIAHDLGTPITRLRLRAEFLEDDELRVKMLRDLEDMQQMVSATLSFIREESASEPSSTADIGSLLERVCNDLEDAGHEVTLGDVPRWTLVDCRPVALGRALSNLLDNAVKYGKSAQVSVVIEADMIKILIDDNGPGIAKEFLEEVFQPFYRLEESRNRETGGNGLGLSVARTIVQAHGGDIHLHNRLKGGLCVELRLPLSRAQDNPPAIKQNEPENGEPEERNKTWKTL
jgi:signal transduction histidine kinase